MFAKKEIKEMRDEIMRLRNRIDSVSHRCGNQKQQINRLIKRVEDLEAKKKK